MNAKRLKHPFNKIHRLVELLSDVFDHELLSHWFQPTHEMFDGLKPAEVVERDAVDRLWNMDFQLRSGMPG